MVPLIGYVDRFSARPGERVAVKVSSQLDRPYRADLCGSSMPMPNPAGPGIELQEVSAALAGNYPSRFQPVHLGSCGVVVPAEPLALPDPGGQRVVPSAGWGEHGLGPEGINDQNRLPFKLCPYAQFVTDSLRWREMDSNLQFLARGDQFVPRFVRSCFTQRPSVSSHGIRRRPPPIR